MTRKWFTGDSCSVLEVRKNRSISVHEVVRSVMIDDHDAVVGIMHRIETLSAEGRKMVSFGPDAESIDLLFHCADHGTQKVEIYEKRFKTPSTGFNDGPNETEARLYADIDALLFPALDKPLLKIKDLAMKFDRFSLTYLGERRSAEAPVTASWVADRFRVSGGAHSDQVIEIRSGQRPPAPQAFDVDGVGYLLLTHKTQEGTSLDSHHFQVIGGRSPER